MEPAHASREDEERTELRHELASRLVRGSAWGADHIDHAKPCEPARLIAEARRALRGLDAAPAPAAADRLAEASRVLLQLVEEARYPLWAEGHAQADYYRDEADELVSLAVIDQLAAGDPVFVAGVEAAPAFKRRRSRPSSSTACPRVLPCAGSPDGSARTPSRAHPGYPTRGHG